MHCNPPFILLGAARKHFSDVDGKRGDDNAISPTRTTRMSPRRAQGRTSPMPTADLRSRRGRHSTLNAETKNESEEGIHNASKVRKVCIQNF